MSESTVGPCGSDDPGRIRMAAAGLDGGSATRWSVTLCHRSVFVTNWQGVAIRLETAAWAQLS